MSLEDALVALRAVRRDSDVVVTTMAAAKVWTDLAGGPVGLHPRDFVFVPSCMGHATSFGLGIALAQPKRRVVVVNGDGSMLMNLGSLATIASQAPRNLVIVVCVNGVYEVTGSQPVPADVDFAAIARACGFAATSRFRVAAAWRTRLARVLRRRGPTLVVLDVAVDRARPAPRSPGPPAPRARALRAALTA
jgi:thiamine pyrophosphate-dependent acetolactate synthase large subunit-like protein